jgi:alkylation response protein AidB-like acyl-CoA dehydrogenase
VISFGMTEEQQLIRDTVRAFAASELRERARECDEAGRMPQELLDKSWELGLATAAIPEEYGGGGVTRSPVTSAIVLEELGAGSAALGAAALAPTLFVHPLVEFGTEEQKQSWLPLFAGSRFVPATLALCEPSFGFDPAKLRTVAEPKGKGFRLSGSKRFVPLGDRASHFLVLARSEARVQAPALDAFIVPRDAKGLEVAPDAEQTLGLRSLALARLELDRVEVPASARLGGESGIDGRRLLQLCRCGSLALAVGLARGMLELAAPYAKERVAFGEPIARKQAIAFMLADMQIEVHSMRWLVWKAASFLEHGRDAARETALASVYVAREAMKIADNGLQIFGGHGYIRDYPVEMWYRDARTLTLCDALVAL